MDVPGHDLLLLDVLRAEVLFTIETAFHVGHQLVLAVLFHGKGVLALRIGHGGCDQFTLHVPQLHGRFDDRGLVLVIDDDARTQETLLQWSQHVEGIDVIIAHAAWPVAGEVSTLVRPVDHEGEVVLGSIDRRPHVHCGGEQSVAGRLGCEDVQTTEACMPIAGEIQRTVGGHEGERLIVGRVDRRAQVLGFAPLGTHFAADVDVRSTEPTRHVAHEIELPPTGAQCRMPDGHLAVVEQELFDVTPSVAIGPRLVQAQAAQTVLAALRASLEIIVAGEPQDIAACTGSRGSFVVLGVHPGNRNCVLQATIHRHICAEEVQERLSVPCGRAFNAGRFMAGGGEDHTIGAQPCGTEIGIWSVDGHSPDLESLQVLGEFPGETTDVAASGTTVGLHHLQVAVHPFLRLQVASIAFEGLGIVVQVTGFAVEVLDGLCVPELRFLRIAHTHVTVRQAPGHMLVHRSQFGGRPVVLDGPGVS